MKPFTYRFPVLSSTNYDGDSLTLIIDMGFYLRKKVKMRLKDIDTPEIRGGTPGTKRLAQKAKQFVENFMDVNKRVVFLCYDRADKYGRALGDIQVETQMLTQELLRERLAVKWTGKRTHKSHFSNVTFHGLD